MLFCFEASIRCLTGVEKSVLLNALCGLVLVFSSLLLFLLDILLESYSGSKKSFIMSKFFRVVFLSLFIAVSVPFTASADERSSDFDWNPVMDAIIQVESKGNPNARCGIWCGVLQISPALVTECNNILKRSNSKKRYTLADRFNVGKSKEMFVLIQSYYNPQNNIEKAIRMWNGGIGYSVKRTQRYYEKVMSFMN